MTFKFIKILVFLSWISLTGCSSNIESEDQISKSIEGVESKLKEMLPESIQLISVNETDIEGYFEVNFEGIEPLYVSDDGEYLISGDIYKITKQGLINKSDARRDYQRISLLKELDEQEFITFEPDSVLHTVYVFTDVDCGYCRQFHGQIADYLKLGIRVNYLAFPRAGLESDSYRKIASAWCSSDPHESLTTLKLGDDIKNNMCANNPVEKHYKLGSSIGIQGTPSIITEEGKLIPGYLPPEDLLNQLTANS